MLAIHHFDNTVEIVLKCIATKHKLKPNGKYFKFEELLGKIRDLPLENQIRGLHEMRNTVQHQADIPSFEVVTKYRGYVEDFFGEAVSKEFGVSYERLYLSGLIENKELSKKVLAAEVSFGKGEYRRCIELCDDAFISAAFAEADIVHLAGKLTRYWGASEELRKVISKEYPDEKYKGKDFFKIVKELGSAILQLGQAATSMQFLGDYRTEFLKHRRIIDNLENLQDNEIKEGAESSLNFVTDLILKWQEEGIFRGEKPEKNT